MVEGVARDHAARRSTILEVDRPGLVVAGVERVVRDLHVLARAADRVTVEVTSELAVGDRDVVRLADVERHTDVVGMEADIVEGRAVDIVVPDEIAAARICGRGGNLPTVEVDVPERHVRGVDLDGPLLRASSGIRAGAQNVGVAGIAALDGHRLVDVDLAAMDEVAGAHLERVPGQRRPGIDRSLQVGIARHEVVVRVVDPDLADRAFRQHAVDADRDARRAGAAMAVGNRVLERIRLRLTIVRRRVQAARVVGELAIRPKADGRA